MLCKICLTVITKKVYNKTYAHNLQIRVRVLLLPTHTFPEYYWCYYHVTSITQDTVLNVSRHVLNSGMCFLCFFCICIVARLAAFTGKVLHVLLFR